MSSAIHSFWWTTYLRLQMESAWRRYSTTRYFFYISLLLRSRCPLMRLILIFWADFGLAFWLQEMGEYGLLFYNSLVVFIPSILYVLVTGELRKVSNLSVPWLCKFGTYLSTHYFEGLQLFGLDRSSVCATFCHFLRHGLCNKLHNYLMYILQLCTDYHRYWGAQSRTSLIVKFDLWFNQEQSHRRVCL